MAHFAKLDNDNVVTQVIVVSNADCGGGDFPESEPIGQAFIQSLGLGAGWKQTSYNHNFRKHYGCVGYTYDYVLDAFIEPKPFPSWILNDETCEWQSPVAYPTDGGPYTWDEETLSWVAVSASRTRFV